MASVAVKISEDVASVLRAATVEGNAVRLPDGQMDRKLYQATDKVLQALGGKWNTKAKAHVFANDPGPELEIALSDGRAVDDLLTRKKRLQLFETPVELADHLVSQLGCIENRICLEPSAGRGRIVQALALRDPARLVAVEIDADNVEALLGQKQSHRVISGDFLVQNPADLSCDAIAMNPPFTRNQDIRHVRHAYECLKPGGRMAAIVSLHGFIGSENECVEWRKWLDSVGAEVRAIPAGAFKESGTSIETRMIVITKALQS